MFAVQVYSDGCEEAVNEFLETNIDIIGGELEYKFSTSLIMLKLMFTVQMKLFSAVAHCFPLSSYHGTSHTNNFSLSSGSLVQFD